MNFNMQVTGMAELRQRIEAMKARAADLKPGLTRAAMVVLRAAQDHIKSGAGDQGPWAPNQTGTPLLWRSGRLMNSLTIGGEANLLNLTDSSVEVGTSVKNYPRWMQEGTGIYGPTGKPIFPKNGKWLAWGGEAGEGGQIVGGTVVRSIKGSPKRRFLYIDNAQAERIRAVFADYILKGLPTNADTG
jgi:phage gpG-like protein